MVAFFDNRRSPASRSIFERRGNDAYGNTLIFTAADSSGNWWSDSAVQSSYGANDIIYCGYRYDAETDNYYVRNRYYSPILGRWLTRDPIGYQGGANLYGYVGGTAPAVADPQGTGPYYDQLMERWWEREKAKRRRQREMTAPCCEGSKRAPRVPVYVINRSGGFRTNDNPLGNSGHIDMAIPGIGLFGFYGYGPGSSGNEVGIGFHGYWNHSYRDFARAGLGRRRYIDGRAGLLSTICVVMVCPSQVSEMAHKLHQMERHPGKFDIVGNNCSTHACDVLGAGGILKRGIPGLDTPQHLEDALVRRYLAKCFDGYTQLSSSNKFKVIPSRKAPPATPKYGGGSL
jgi:RHS repeat-associated protein